MRILWFSNGRLSANDPKSTGSWLAGMARGLAASGHVDLANITSGRVSEITREDHELVVQWVVPLVYRLSQKGLPPRATITAIAKAVESFAPDLVHVWGTENYWGLLTARGLTRARTLLEMQGIKREIAWVFHGGLTFKEQVACTGVKEILRMNTLWQEKARFRRWGRLENEMLAGHRYIGAQTDWIAAQVKCVNQHATIYHNDRLLRRPFYTENEAWSPHRTSELFCLASSPAAYKGLHVVVRAHALLRKRFPALILSIGGGLLTKGIRRNGYIAWLQGEIDGLGLKDHVRWLGALDAREIIACMRRASAVIIPSFIENCCNAMQEAMKVGAPVVASYAGGLPCLARDEASALYFPMGDAAACASRIEQVLTHPELAESLSRAARSVAATRNCPERIISRQLEIYMQVLAEK
ncbi:MAG: glycosyltransferase family 4 protein [Desulfatitalea sp.]|nr:glycosyltransferase family 4 protein [Desulfatitalea sp.]NNJ99368.1 glycosyltransferase family 4 protein [Desulfatitalea sp.]